jgi:hypothetical protein
MVRSARRGPFCFCADEPKIALSMAAPAIEPIMPPSGPPK